MKPTKVMYHVEAESSKCLNNTLDARLELTRVKGEVFAQKQIFRTISESGKSCVFFLFLNVAYENDAYLSSAFEIRL